MFTARVPAHPDDPGADGERFRPQRIEALDVVRGVAVLGILLINIPLFGMPIGAYAVAGEAGQGADFYVWAFNEILIEGTMRALFSMLFGASMLLMTGVVAAGTTIPAAAGALDIYARRALWLVAFGIVHAYVLLWPHDVLYAYGLLGLLLLPFRLLSARRLLAAGLVMLATAALISGLEGPEQESDPARYGLMERSLDGASLPGGWADLTPSADEVRLGAGQAEAQDAIDTRRSGYWDNFRDMAPTTASMQSERFYRTSVFDIGGMMLIGMALLKAGVLAGRRSRRFYWTLLAAGYGVGLAVNGVETWASVVPPEDSAKLIYWSEVTYDLGRLPTAVGHVAALMLLLKTRMFESAARLFSAAGRLALTNYVMQTVICNALFLGAGLGLYGRFSLHQLMIAAILTAAAQIVFSILWLRNYRMGPLEWALRSLVHWSPQPLRLRTPQSVAVTEGAAGV